MCVAIAIHDCFVAFHVFLSLFILKSGLTQLTQQVLDSGINLDFIGKIISQLLIVSPLLTLTAMQDSDPQRGLVKG
jgi:hypothetical protein